MQNALSSDLEGRPALSSAATYAALSGPGAAPGLASAYLSEQLALAAPLACDLPHDPDQLGQWAQERHAEVTASYQAYLAQRRAGAPRAYFTNLAHALYFIRNVGPTKLVDGAWLYSALNHWQDKDFHPLHKTYLEELGCGDPTKNHVVLYQRLLDQYGCASHEDLSDAHFTQGAIQLSLGEEGGQHQPEMVGYNLGYEQLPLHLLITAYELNELGVDPYYFTLHVTVDNASTGHAHDAIAALQRLLARDQDRAGYYRRVREGYKLNDLGEHTLSVIASFDLQAELVRIMQAKAHTGKDMHGDYCRVAGKTINAWLSDPARIPALLEQFERSGWITRGKPAAESRFWGLIQGERAEMFGVFSPYEQQVLADWIMTPAGERQTTGRVMSFRARQRARALPTAPAPARPARPVIRHGADNDESGNPLRQLEQAVAAAAGKNEAIALLIPHLAPTAHHTATGLMATRMFTQLAFEP